MHNGQLANPLNEITKQIKAISGKRAKTDADLEEMARLEWHGSLYTNEKGKICIPGQIFEAVLFNAAKGKKLGKKALAGLFCDDNFVLDFPDKDKSIDKLWENSDYRFSALVVIQRSRIMRMRPIFKKWSAIVVVEFDEKVFNEREVIDIVQMGGDIGIGDWRPRYGKFTVEKV
ncbi:MAG: hypothetical protein KJ941_03895 [Bacteroidetes bacterium]|nr:hypothetical protein [Bacteroidota bacterium]